MSAQPVRCSCGVSVEEIEGRTKALGRGSGGAGGTATKPLGGGIGTLDSTEGIGIALTTLHDLPVRDAHDGVEMAVEGAVKGWVERG